VERSSKEDEGREEMGRGGRIGREREEGEGKVGV